MKERPILFGAPMVRAILAGTKTQTRRVMKPQPEVTAPDRWGETWSWPSHACRSMVCLRDAPCLSPYGYKGDRLWVKETWRTSVACDPLAPTRIVGHGWPVWYGADDAVIWSGAKTGGPAFRTPGKTRVSIHMPRAFSRITLEVTGVRVERLHAITEEDARAEGVGHTPAGTDDDGAWYPAGTSRDAFAALWREINGSESWERNDWVWVVEFKRIEAAERAA